MASADEIAAAWARPVLSRADVALVLGCHPNHLSRMIRAGHFPAANCFVGRTGHWRKQTVARWIERGGTSRRKRGAA